MHGTGLSLTHTNIGQMSNGHLAQRNNSTRERRLRVVLTSPKALARPSEQVPCRWPLVSTKPARLSGTVMLSYAQRTGQRTGTVRWQVDS